MAHLVSFLTFSGCGGSAGKRALTCVVESRPPTVGFLSIRIAFAIDSLLGESPRNGAAVMKVHLGCGKRHIPGFHHVDALSYPHVDHVGPVDKLSHIGDEIASLVYACHVLEHFGRNQYQEVIREWYRILRPGGVLRLAVPDFSAVASMYVQGDAPGGIEGLLGFCVGGQRDEYDFHKMVFDEDLLSRSLLEVGFSTVRRWDWEQAEHSDIDDYSQSYLPHMDKENGTLMSLNLEGVK